MKSTNNQKNNFKSLTKKIVFNDGRERMASQKKNWLKKLINKYKEFKKNDTKFLKFKKYVTGLRLSIISVIERISSSDAEKLEKKYQKNSERISFYFDIIEDLCHFGYFFLILLKFLIILVFISITLGCFCSLAMSAIMYYFYIITTYVFFLYWAQFYYYRKWHVAWWLAQVFIYYLGYLAIFWQTFDFHIILYEGFKFIYLFMDPTLAEI